MTDLFPLISLAATAGLLAFFSPCGYALLPAYVGFFLAKEDKTATPANSSSRGALAKQGLITGLFVILGFGTVLAVLWLVVGTIGNIIGTFLPRLALVVGILLVVAGIYLFIKPSKLSIPLPAFMSKTRHGYLGAYFFGLAYIIGGIGCTLPIFIAVLAQAAILGPAQSLLAFGAFAGTMSLLLLIITLLLVIAKQALFNKLKKLLPYIARAGAVLLVLAGIYLIFAEL